jgi:enoyl-CoA hydratase/carnithine racemase
LALASEYAAFGPPEARIGASPMIFATFGPFLLGLKIANESTMLCEPISAERALALGLINMVVPPKDLMPAASEMVQELMKSSPISLRVIEETSSRILGERLYDFWISQLKSLKEISRSEDWVEGASSFIEKRSPQFNGR